MIAGGRLMIGILLLVCHDVDEAAGDDDDLADGLAGGELLHAGQGEGGTDTHAFL